MERVREKENKFCDGEGIKARERSKCSVMFVEHCIQLFRFSSVSRGMIKESFVLYCLLNKEDVLYIIEFFIGKKS